jgi:hypothetical protein
VSELEILLLLNDNPEKEWTAIAINESIHIDPSAVEGIARRFESLKLFGSREIEGRRVYRLNPSDPSVRTALNELRQLYATHRIKVLTAICTNPMDKIQTFPEAP